MLGLFIRFLIFFGLVFSVSLARAELRLYQQHTPNHSLNNSDRFQSFDPKIMKLCEAQMIKTAQKYNIPVGILYAVGLTETGQKNSLQPYALNIEGKAFFAKSLPEALVLFQKAKAKGAVLIDVGCMQINVHYHGQAFRSIASMFDPALNVDYAGRFLKKLYKKEKTWTMAIARYHAGPNNNPAQKKYVCQVIRNLVAVGFGAWTAQSKAFCSI